MEDRISEIAAFLTELERLKLVSRRAYVSNLSRRENAAEHSWHLAMGLLIIADELDVEIDLHKALVMALVHDVCEIDAGDTPIYGPVRPDQFLRESQCIERLTVHKMAFSATLRALWQEYEMQQTRESRWVKVLDRVTPFIVNLASEGKTWKEQGISRSQVIRVNEPVREHAPEIYEWMLLQIDQCVRQGWLHDA